MRALALLTLTMAVACKPAGLNTDDADTDAGGTDAPETDLPDTDPPAVDAGAWEIDPTAAQTFTGTVVVADRSQSLAFDDLVVHDVVELGGVRYRNFIGRVGTTIPSEGGAAPASMEVRVIVPESGASPGVKDCTGPASGYGLTLALYLGNQLDPDLAVSSALLSADGGLGSCALNVQQVSLGRFVALVGAADLVDGRGGQATLQNLSVDLTLVEAPAE